MHRPKKVSTDNYSKLCLTIYLTAQSPLGLRHHFNIVLHCQVEPGGASRCVRLAEKVKVFISRILCHVLIYKGQYISIWLYEPWCSHSFAKARLNDHLNRFHRQVFDELEQIWYSGVPGVW